MAGGSHRPSHLQLAILWAPLLAVFGEGRCWVCWCVDGGATSPLSPLLMLLLEGEEMGLTEGILIGFEAGCLLEEVFRDLPQGSMEFLINQQQHMKSPLFKSEMTRSWEQQLITWMTVSRFKKILASWTDEPKETR